MKKLLIVLGVIFLALIVMFGVIVGVGFIKEKQYDPSAEAFLDVFYENYNNGNFEYIYKELSNDVLRQQTSDEDYQKFFNLFYKKLGKVNSRTKVSWKISYESGKCFYSVKYKVSHEDAESTDSFVLQRVGESWLVQKYYVESEALFPELE